MDPQLRIRVEVETLHEILPELDYYRILEIPPDAPQASVEPAFRKVTRTWHPDRFNRMGDQALRDKVNDIYRFANEAWRVLKDPDARAWYDKERASGNLRISTEGRAGAAQDAAANVNPEFAARTPKGEKHWKMALKCWEDKDFKGCVMQIRFAQQFEPDNPAFKEWLGKAQAAAEEAARIRENPFKLRIV